MRNDLFIRSKANPIIKPTDLPFRVNGVLNPGVAQVDDEGEIWMDYGGADAVVGLAIAKTSDLLDFVLEHDYLHEEQNNR